MGSLGNSGRNWWETGPSSEDAAARRERERQRVIQRNRELAPPDLTDATIRAVREMELRKNEGRSRRSTMRSLLGGM